MISDLETKSVSFELENLNSNDTRKIETQKNVISSEMQLIVEMMTMGTLINVSDL